MLQRMNELAVQAANGTNTESDRAYINSEVQALKEEIDRIFSTTTFNERRIWDPQEVMPIVGYTPIQAVTFRGSYEQNVDITNANCGVVSMDGYKIDANSDGVKVLWTGYDGNSYESERLSWATLKKNNYSFDIKPTDSNGNVLFTYNISMSVQNTATVNDIIDSINGTVLSSTSYINVMARFENADRSEKNADLSISAYINYEAAYASNINSENGYDFDNANDIFFEPELSTNNSNLIKFPSATNIDDAKTSNETWELSFEMKGIGRVVAAPSSFYYYSFDGTNDNDLKNDDKGLWWDTYQRPDGTTYTAVIIQITSTLNADTIVDLYNTSFQNDSSVAWQATVNAHDIELPVYGRSVLAGKEFFWVQSGAEAGQHIEIEYDSLSLWALGIQDTNTLTVEDASNAINEIKDALIIVSDQRSLFGAYQNRLEHAYNINKNVEENTQASESLIRDTDIADAMMEFSINNILLQAGVSMLTQANQSSQLMLELLQ